MALRKLEVYVDEELWTFNVSDVEFQMVNNGNEEVLKFLVAREEEKRSMAVMNEELEIDEPRGPIPEANEIKESFIWPDQAVLLFLETYRNKKDDFASGVKGHNKIWEQIANEMKEAKYNITAAQCQNKMSGLKRTYKNISDSNKKSDNHKSSWAFYSVMDSIFGEKAWVEPVSIASSYGPPSLSCSSSLSKQSLEDEPKPKKKRVESILESFITEIKEDKQKEREEKEQRRAERRTEKEERWKQNVQERWEMHNDRMKYQQSLIDLLAKIAERK